MKKRWVSLLLAGSLVLQSFAWVKAEELMVEEPVTEAAAVSEEKPVMEAVAVSEEEPMMEVAAVPEEELQEIPDDEMLITEEDNAGDGNVENNEVQKEISDEIILEMEIEAVESLDFDAESDEMGALTGDVETAEAGSAIGDSGIAVAAETSGNYTYTVSDTSATITGYSGEASIVVIPSTIDGYTVTGIAEDVFWNKDAIISVTIPEGVTWIGNCAFMGCDSLTSVKLPESLTSIGQAAFEYAPLTSLDIPKNVSYIGPVAFCGCTAIETLTFQENDTEGFSLSIAKNAFNGLSSVKEIAWAGQITSLAEGAFTDCTSLISVTLPEGMQSLGLRAFSGCTSLQELILPQSLTSIGEYIIEGTQITSITVPKNLTSSKLGAFEGAEQLETIVFEEGTAFIPNNICYGSNAKTVVIPEGVTSIGYRAFDRCPNLETINIPKSVSFIGGLAFQTSALKSVTFNENEAEGFTLTIAERAFDGCTGLSEIHWTDQIVSIGPYAFRDCTSLVSVAVPEGVKSLPNGVFQGCTSLAELTLPQSLTYIGRDVIDGTAITSLVIPKNLTSCGESSYLGGLNGADKLETVIFEDGITHIAYSICYDTAVKNVVIPDSVTTIGTHAFASCPNLETIELPNCINSIGRQTFSGCTSLSSITIPRAVKSLSERLLVGCSSLTSVEIQHKVTSIGKRVFENCTALTDIYYRGTEEDWANISVSSGNDVLSTATLHLLPLLDIAECNITLPEKVFEYTGGEICPKIEANDEEYILVEGEDYTLSYRDNIEAGREATVIITGQGDYTGTCEMTFTITPGPVKNLRGNNSVSTETEAYGGVKRNIEVIWDDMENVDGYVIQYSQDSAFETKEEETIDWGDAEYVSNTLDRGSTYYVRVCAFMNVDGEKKMGKWSDTLKVQIGNQILAEEMWGFTNPTYQIDPSYFYRLFTPTDAEEYYQVFGGKFGQNYPVYAQMGGACYGMVMAGLSVMDHNIPADWYGITDLNGVTSFGGADGLWSDDLNMDARDAIIFAHLCQIYDHVSECTSVNKNNIYGLYCVVKDCQTGKTVPVGVAMEENGVKHMMLATGLAEETHAYAKIAVYDPNYPSNSNRYLYLLKENGDFTGWSYEFQNETYWASQLNTADQNGDSLAYDILGAGEIAEILDLYVNTGNFLSIYENEKSLVRFSADKEGESGLMEWLSAYFKYGDPISFYMDAADSDTEEISKLYWVDENTPLTFTNVPAGVTISLSSGYHSVRIEVTEEADITLDVGETSANQVQVTSDHATAFTVTFRDFTSLAEPVKQTVITGTGDGSQTAQIIQTEDQDVQLEGVTSVEYERMEGVVDTNTAVMQNPETAEVEKAETDSAKNYQISEKDDYIEISSSSNNDGVFDTVVDMVKKCAHNYVTVTEKEPTCKEVGIQCQACSICGRKKEGSETELSVIDSHTPDVWKEEVNAICTATGKRVQYCKVCGIRLQEEVIAKKNHSYGAWTTVKEPTALEQGLKQRKCSGCKVVEEETIAMLTPTIELTAKSLKMQVKQSTTAFKVAGMAKGDYLKSVVSDKTSVLKVTKVKANGTFKLTAQKKTGNAVLTIRLASGLEKTVSVKVQKGTVKTTGISGIEKTLTIRKGSKVTLKPVIAPVTSQQKITYSSSNKKVAAVSSKGKITAKAAGKTKITVKSGSKKVTVTVTVPGITNVKTSASVKKGKTLTLKPKKYGISGKVTYTSSNPKVATVSSKGKIQGVKKGKATITVKAGNYAVKCKVTVK